MVFGHAKDRVFEKKKKQNKTKTYQKQKERACKDHFIKAVKRRVKERDMI